MPNHHRPLLGFVYGGLIEASWKGLVRVEQSLATWWSWWQPVTLMPVTCAYLAALACVVLAAVLHTGCSGMYSVVHVTELSFCGSLMLLVLNHYHHPCCHHMALHPHQDHKHQNQHHQHHHHHHHNAC